MPKDPTRRFIILITSTSGGEPREQHVDAAYWQFGLTAGSSETRDNLIVFKGQDGKPVFAVRGDLVETITEIREPQATLTATGNIRLCACGVITGGYVVHRRDCPLSAPHTAAEEAAA